MVSPRYVIGIDLGTTHCAVAASLVSRPNIKIFEVPQLVAPGEIDGRPLLPSFMYLPAPGELSDADRTLPWSGTAAEGGDRGPLKGSTSADAVVGLFARTQGARTPIRLVSSAKSWICHGGVNRRAPILPWSAPDDGAKVSPFEASARYLNHLRAAWDAAHPEALMADQEVVITVPASFDGSACELTQEAARAAGLKDARLLEEPQAAFYDFIGANAESLREQLGDARLALVIDVGGGTTDLTLIKIIPEGDGQPGLERIAVGGHLMLGGDNMDAALAHHLQKAAGIKGRMDPTEWSALVQTARQVKERLLAEDAPEQTTVSIQRRGSRLIGGTRSVTLTRDDAQKILLDGFVPFTAPDEVASRQGRAGLTTLGLPYTTDAAIPRHVCTFLRRHTEAARAAGATIVDGLPRPDVVLLNGGVFNAPSLIERLQGVLDVWYGDASVRLLKHTSLDTAVARGAARSALSRHGLSPAISGGTARAYYVAVEGADGVRQAFCIAPKGMEDGETIAVKDRVFKLVVDRPVSFPLFAYTGDRVDDAGALVPIDEELDELPPLRTTLRVKGDVWVDPETGGVPVNLSSALTEGGALELSLVTVELPPRRWRLQFSLDPQPAPKAPEPAAVAEKKAAPLPPEPPLPEGFSRVQRLLERTFNPHSAGADPKVAKPLRKDLEKELGPRGQWPSHVCRALADRLLKVAHLRGRSAGHELVWLRLMGWCVRPGFGARKDAERIEKLWALWGEGLHNPNDKGLWSEWWVMWRRLAGGLSVAQQRALYDACAPWLSGGKPPPGPRAHGHPEMLRMLAALEGLTSAQKEQSGKWTIARQRKVGSWWPLGRLGARAPVIADDIEVVSTATATAWLNALLEQDWAKAEGAAFAGVMLARQTGIPGRDVDAALRSQVQSRLLAISAPNTWLSLLHEPAAAPTGIAGGTAKALLGDSLPTGLRLD
ncbi:MAG: Hsp70 family protein [Bradymonadia bacterium]